eukprot:g8544.t1
MDASQKLKLTKRVVEAASPEPQKRTYVWDTEITGFCVRIYPTGRKTYFLQFRNAQRQSRKVKIGVHGNITTEQAREQAVQLSLKISAGQDPSQKITPVSHRSTFEKLAHDYWELYAKVNKRPKSLLDDRRMMDTILIPKFGHFAVADLTSHELQTLHKNLQNKPYLANRVRSLLSKMFSLAKEWGWISDNPVLCVFKYQEQKRTRFLTGEELGRLWETLDRDAYHITSWVFKFLILTGARKGEALKATWDQFDLESGTWIKPSHLTKQKRTEHLPLSSEAVALLKTLKTQRKEQSLYVFPGKCLGEPLKEIKKYWASVSKRAGLEDIRIHDLRHTYASHLVSSGLSLSIVGKLLGHTQASTTQRYAHLHDEPLKQATSLFSQQLRGFVEKQKEA